MPNYSLLQQVKLVLDDMRCDVNDVSTDGLYMISFNRGGYQINVQELTRGSITCDIVDPLMQMVTRQRCTSMDEFNNFLDSV